LSKQGKATQLEYIFEKYAGDDNKNTDIFVTNEEEKQPCSRLEEVGGQCLPPIAKINPYEYIFFTGLVLRVIKGIAPKIVS